jgi:MerR family transcriptional regulator, thiopeptide resistance regulator
MPTIERVIPLLACRDIAAEHDFLVKAFGFASGGLHRTPDGKVVHGEVKAGDSEVWLHRVALEHGLDSALGTEVTNIGLCVQVDDVDAHWQQARAAGAQILSAPVDQPYGLREYGARDAEGHRWYFTAPVKAESA